MFKFKGISSDTMSLAVKTEIDPAIATPRVETVKVLGADGLIPVTDGIDARRAEFLCTAIGNEQERRVILSAAGDWLQGAGTLEVHGGSYEMTCSGISQNAMTAATGEFTVAFIGNGIREATGSPPPLIVKGEKGDKGDPGDSAYEVWKKATGGSLEEFLAYIKGQKGEQGAKGETGEKGEQGSQGDQGLKGEQGDTGKSAYQIWLDNGHQGTEQEFLESLKNGPKGEDGKDGKSAYQVWLDKGNVGDEVAFLASLKGDKGDPGKDGEKGADGQKGEQGQKGDAGEKGSDGQPGQDGKSAYQLWLDEGNVGGVDDFLASLKGEKGDPGSAGGSIPSEEGFANMRYWGNKLQVKQGQTWADVLVYGIDTTSVTDGLMAALAVDVQGTTTEDAASAGTFALTDHAEVFLR